MERFDQSIKLLEDQFKQQKLHIITLQEVTDKFLERLKAQKWVQDHFILSHITVKDTLGIEYGQLILSRYLVREFKFNFLSGYKFALIGHYAFEIPKEEQYKSKHFELAVATIHLSSSVSSNSTQRRWTQSERLFKMLNKYPEAIITGDFNLEQEEDRFNIHQYSFIDVYDTLYPNTTGYTFDPKTNPTAKIMSKAQLSRRFDRMLLKTMSCSPKSFTILNEQIMKTYALHDIYPSDHYPIRMTLKF